MRSRSPSHRACVATAVATSASMRLVTASIFWCVMFICSFTASTCSLASRRISSRSSITSSRLLVSVLISMLAESCSTTSLSCSLCSLERDSFRLSMVFSWPSSCSFSTSICSCMFWFSLAERIEFSACSVAVVSASSSSADRSRTFPVSVSISLCKPAFCSSRRASSSSYAHALFSISMLMRSISSCRALVSSSSSTPLANSISSRSAFS
mmetsp:Transcript_35454/g.67896  ORF Transcript_35454/g.67896 Transcript_35454/m.67896 type:complete len:211 (+) Transcript_35454:744-1376(+)